MEPDRILYATARGLITPGISYVQDGQYHHGMDQLSDRRDHVSLYMYLLPPENLQDDYQQVIGETDLLWACIESGFCGKDRKKICRLSQFIIDR